MGREPASLGFTRSMFGEENAANFKIVKDGLADGDPYRFHAARQELLGFQLARQHGEDSWAPRHVLETYGRLLGRDGGAIWREYLEPVDRETPLPMSARSTATARRLLSSRGLPVSQISRDE